MQHTISSFLLSNQVATICCLDGEEPYCFNCFYHFEPQQCLLLFKSSPDAYHASLLAKDTQVAGTILPGAINFSVLQGIQFWGTATPRPDGELQALYHAQFPIAESITGNIYSIQLHRVKMTDNSRGFGHKLQWRADPLKTG